MKDLNIYDIQTFFCTGTDDDNFSLLYRPVPVGSLWNQYLYQNRFCNGYCSFRDSLHNRWGYYGRCDHSIKKRGRELDFLDRGKLPDLSDQSECRQYSDSFSGNGSLSEAGIGAFRGFWGCYGSYHGKNHPSLGYWRRRSSYSWGKGIKHPA